ncbi:histidine phosphatase family protein [Moraxella canis]|uniref:Histidine phosphatase family protein n=1 Tax=Moraxella canis TaxID=90239 RepID=A0A1S9ZQ23_9GAMM|nr:histidine phosphatase family protein [Moraxella canis]OOR85556.1 hypothetical protein B0180_01855 [Moraxella canis]
MISLSVLRHGETRLLTSGVLRGRTDDALTQKGWAQMHASFDDNFLSNQWQMIITSPLSRCLDFAKIKALQYKLGLVVLDELQEMDFGEWEGQRTADLYQKYPNDLSIWWQTPTAFTPPNGESVYRFARRIDEGLAKIEQICQTHHHQKVCMISHGGVIKYLYCRAQGLSLDSILTMPADLGELHHFGYHQGRLKI